MTKISDFDLQDVTGGTYSGSVFKYQVQRGDVLSVIAQRYHTDVKTLCELNSIHNADAIEVGQIILVPYNA